MSKSFPKTNPKGRSASAAGHAHLMHRLADDLLEAAAHYCEGCAYSYPFCSFDTCSAYGARSRALSIRRDLRAPQGFGKS